MVKGLPKQMSNRKPKKGEVPVHKLKLNPGESKQWQCMTDDEQVLATIWQEEEPKSALFLQTQTLHHLQLQFNRSMEQERTYHPPLAVDLYNNA